ncbi:MAG: hypothetical protein U9O94_00075 [Nanoarchaeota archaeon]|nr:hypothetical protein [Nanoarchaeota archaeon]
MKNLKLFDRKDKKRFLEILKKQFGFEDKLDYNFFINTKNKVFIVNKEIAEIDLSKIRINSLGSYIAEYRHDEVRLTIEGSQIIGEKAKKNILELNDPEIKEWLSGKDIDKQTDLKGFVIIKNKEDFIGSGKVSNNRILNYVPKIRRINV